MSLSGFRNKFVKVKTSKKRKISSNKWLQRQLNDPFVAKAKIDGYRSRAAYKLIEINDKFKLFHANSKVVDLGAAPGGWSQVAANMSPITHKKNQVIAIDLLEMEEIPGVQFIQGSFYDEHIINLIKQAIQGNADLVLSDMAANTTGHSKTDHIRIIDLCDRALDFALTILKPGGHFVAKIFRGGAESEILNKAKLNFAVVKHFKPKSSRKESAEFYLVAKCRKSISTA
ncbi:MAG: RlmE family RNA methyltransferase [Rickettsiaceae bacterium]|nr:MAG: RlmE family RNA methyltransferase [Rickettsiaceae bacterium]